MTGVLIEGIIACCVPFFIMLLFFLFEDHLSKRSQEKALVKSPNDWKRKRRQEDMAEWQARYEALLPHEEHSPKDRFSPLSGCRECERVRQNALARYRMFIESI